MKPKDITILIAILMVATNIIWWIVCEDQSKTMNWLREANTFKYELIEYQEMYIDILELERGGVLKCAPSQKIDSLYNTQL